MLKSSVFVLADDQGRVVHVSENNPEFGYVQVQQIVKDVNSDGWLRVSNRHAIIKGKVSDLMEMNFQPLQKLDGMIYVRESLTPPNPNNPEQGMKRSGAEGIPCMLDDQPIYRETIFSFNEDEKDVFIEHNNKEEVRSHSQRIREKLKEWKERTLKQQPVNLD